MVSRKIELKEKDCALILGEGLDIKVIIPKGEGDEEVSDEAMIVGAIGAILTGKKKELFDKLIELVDEVFDE